MEDEISDAKALIFYFFRERYYHCMINECKRCLLKYKDQIAFHLYHACALLLCNRIEECINELESIKAENDVKLAVVIALMYAHKILGLPNKDVLYQLDAEMRDLRKSTESVDFYHSAFVLFALNKPEKAIDYLEKCLTIQSDFLDAKVLKGWILLALRNKGHKSAHNLMELYESSLRNNKRNLDATLGISQSFLTHKKFDEALANINKTIVRFPGTNLPVIAKMKIQFAMFGFEQTKETISRILKADPNCLDALKMNIILLLCFDSNYNEAIVSIKRLNKELDVQEPKNFVLLLENAQLFSKICGRNPDVLQETLRMVEKSIQINSESVDCITELANQFYLSKQVKEALKYYKTASKMDESSLRPLMGLTICEFSQKGNSEQIKSQVGFLLDMEEAQNSSLLYWIRANIADTLEETLIFLKKSCDLQISAIKTISFSPQYLQVLDPNFMLEVIANILKFGYSSSEINPNSVRTSTTFTTSAQNVLKIVHKACPGLNEPLFLLAKLQYFSGDIANSMNSLDQILNRVDDEMASEVHLLTAQIQIQTGYYDRASQSLEVCLSHNFKVRENPMYHYIRALVDKNTNNLQDAVKSLTTALKLISDKSKNLDLNLSAKSSIYIELIEVQNSSGQAEEAAKLLESAIEEFQGTPEEARILILSAEHAIKRKNIQGAIDLLTKVQPKESYYLQAKNKLADIFLTYQMDKYAYLQCYQEMVDQNPKSESYCLLGDAYMNILEPDDALECYNLALQQNPQDPFLTSKMGKALVETHYFAKAIAFYKDSIKTTQNTDLKLQLAELYMQLKEFDKAQILLMNELEVESTINVDDLVYMQYKTKLLLLLAQTQEKAGNLSSSLNTLKDARDNQQRVRRRFTVDHSVVPQEEICLLAEIGVKLAEISTTLKHNEQAIQFYKDVSDVCPNDPQILAALAKLYMQINYLEACQQICTSILVMDPENETASVMMADIAFRKIDFDMALFHFTQLISKQPTNWTALVRLVEIMRRTGNIHQVPEYLSNAENSLTNPSKDAGFLFCTGLYQWYSGNLNGALRSFNGARQDPEWGQLALYNMIEICLNPDDELLGEQFMDSDDSEYRDSRSMALKTADRLLKELKHRLESSSEDMLRYRLLVNFRLIATQDKANIERGLDDFIALASQTAYKDQVGPILGMSTAYTLQRQSQRAKNQLKRVAKTVWTFEDAEYLERCWLLLADYYIQSTKLDVAAELLHRVVQHNKACSKAHELLGLISEKDQRYKEAVLNYEMAWRFGGKSNAGIGYKLAYNLMKSKNFAEAIEIGHQVLKLNPDYPKVQKDILDKSMNNLRV